MSQSNEENKELELQSLRAEVAKLKTQQAAFEVQSKLLGQLVAMARSPEPEEVVIETLQSTLDIAAQITAAEKGSLFLLDSNGVVTDSILTQREATAKTRRQLIGTVLDKGLAGWVSRNKTLGLIEDTETDDRWITLPNQPYQVRSALAMPIFKGEELQGILTLLHCQPCHFNEESIARLQITVEHIALVLEQAKLYGQLEIYSRALNNELEKGRQIQCDFLPYEIIKPKNWEIVSFFRPAKQVSGDFYDAFPIGEYVGLVIADVCDKGVGAALFMALMRSLIRIFSTQPTMRGMASNLLEENKPSGGWLGKPSTNLAHLKALHAVELTNDYVAENHWQLSMFATMFFAILEPNTGLLTYINGGHEPLYILNSQGIKQTLPPTGPAVGMMPQSTFAIGQIELTPGDILLGYTDGVTDGKNLDGQLFSSKRLESIVVSPVANATELIDIITTNIFNHIGNAPQFDDITMLAVQRIG